MDIRIGIFNTQRELNFESRQSASEVESEVAAALESGTKILKLRDSKGSSYLIPVEAVAYVEVGTEESRRIGFVG